MFESKMDPHFNGDVTALVLDPLGITPNRIIRRSDDWRLDVTIDLTGDWIRNIGGDLHIQPYIEGLGVDYEGPLDVPASVKLNASASYTVSFAIKSAASTPANSQGVSMVAGPYRLSVTVTYTDLVGKPDEVAGFVELGIVQFYDAA